MLLHVGANSNRHYLAQHALNLRLETQSALTFVRLSSGALENSGDASVAAAGSHSSRL